jgi:hypothetical protein
MKETARAAWHAILLWRKIRGSNGLSSESSEEYFDPELIVNAKIFVRIPRKTRFLKKAGFPDLSGKNF